MGMSDDSVQAFTQTCMAEGALNNMKEMLNLCKKMRQHNTKLHTIEMKIQSNKAMLSTTDAAYLRHSLLEGTQ